MSSARDLRRERDATRFVDLDGPFTMCRGGVLPGVRLAYESWGRLNAARDNAVLLFTGLSPSAHAASSEQDPSPGWWEYMVGPGKPIDTDRYFVVCCNNLGSCFGSTGPASIDPRTGEPHRLGFPELAIEDIAAAARAAVRALGIERVSTVVGASLGGMAALAYAVRYPEEVGAVATLSAAAQATPFAIAVRSLQREMIRSDPAWRGGDYDEQPADGMRLARKLGLTSYRSGVEWLERFGRERVPAEQRQGEPFEREFQIESYLEANARKFVGGFDANCYLYLSRAMDWFDLTARDGGSLTGALGRVRARRHLVIGVETDFLFPLWQQRELADALARVGHEVRFTPLASPQGHDAFLVDEARFAPAVGAFFADG
ncbi:MAG: homoserine O-acetyltransferase [Gammaproteobacteria bacterium]|nr:homoserine O-acetyltransferase [Gammaproteobacteria bacterium]